MKLTTNVKFFLAIVAIVFALQVMFDIQAELFNPGEAFLNRITTAALIAAGVTFLWNQFRPKKPS
ncbi:MAG TPA: hypothetical protein VEI26_02490 [Terriglobales bacterium]|nr:hypothetical protein [Terriglobales bacterium]